MSDAAGGLITKKDVKDVHEAFVRGAGDQQDSTLKKVKSHLNKLVKAATLEGIDFEKVIRQVRGRHSALKKANRKRKNLSEAMVKIARVQSEQPDKQVTQAQVDEVCEPFASKKPKLPLGRRMDKIAEGLSDAEARRLLEKLQERLGANGAEKKPARKKPVEKDTSEVTAAA